MTLVCQEDVSQLLKFSQRVAMGVQNDFAAKGLFRSQALISQQMTIFVGASFGLRNFADHEFSLALELLLTPRDLPSISLQLLLN